MKVLILDMDNAREGKVQGGKIMAAGQDYRNTFSQDWHLSFVLCCAQTSRPQLSWDITYYVWMSFQSDLKDRHSTPSERQ